MPYIIMFFTIGMPFFLLELSLGQFTSQSLACCWECVPCMKGIGLAMAFISFMISIYYNVIISWAIFYFGTSFTSELPWERCNDNYAGDCKNIVTPP